MAQSITVVACASSDWSESLFVSTDGILSFRSGFSREESVVVPFNSRFLGTKVRSE